MRKAVFGEESIERTIHDTRFQALQIIKKGITDSPHISLQWRWRSAEFGDLRTVIKNFFESFEGNPFDFTYVRGSGNHDME